MGVHAPRTARRRRLGAELKALREAAGLSMERAADRIHGDNSKISRLETGRQRITRLELDALLELYGVPDGRKREALTALASEARRRSWWRQYGDLPPSLQEGLDLESDAAQICAFQPLLIPGLLQTEAYAAAVIGAFPGGSGKDLEDFVALRMGRQKIFERPEPLHYVCVLTESTLRQEVGGRAVMAAQLRHLRRMSDPPYRTIQVIPYAQGAHVGLAGGFALYSYPGPMDLDVVAIEYSDGGLYLEEERPVTRYRMDFEQLRASALSSRQSMDLISRIAGELDDR